MPKHLERICSAIDEIPSDMNFEVSRQSELRFPDDSALQLQQELEDYLSQQSDADYGPAWKEDDSFIGSQDNTAPTFFTHEPKFKEPRNKRTA